MSMINKEISDFSVMAFHKGECRTVTKKDVLGKWSVLLLSCGFHLRVSHRVGGSCR